MNNDDLKTIWICPECRSTFIFHSDVDEHKVHTGHLRIQKYGLLSHGLVDRIDA
jgi:hypothetical protein